MSFRGLFVQLLGLAAAHPREPPGLWKTARNSHVSDSFICFHLFSRSQNKSKEHAIL